MTQGGDVGVPHPKLPGVLLISLAQLALAVVVLVFGVVLGLTATVLLGPVAGIYVAIWLWFLASVLITAGLGLLNLKNWARIVSISLAVLTAILTLANSNLRGSVLAPFVMVAALTISWYLTRANVRAAFR
jgi:hypothetical protein